MERNVTTGGRHEQRVILRVVGVCTLNHAMKLFGPGLGLSTLLSFEACVAASSGLHQGNANELEAKSPAIKRICADSDDFVPLPSRSLRWRCHSRAPTSTNQLLCTFQRVVDRPCLVISILLHSSKKDRTVLNPQNDTKQATLKISVATRRAASELQYGE